MVRPLPVLALLTLALAACKAPPSKREQAAASSAPPAAASSAPAGPAQPQHNWAYRQGDAYAYEAQGGEDRATMIRYLGQQDGTYTVIETQDGAIVAASCARPCDTVRLRGKGLDQTLALSPTSVIYAALSDAMNGQLEVYKPPASGRKTTASPQ